MRVRTPLDLGAALRSRRRALGMSQKEAARRASVGRQWIIDVEAGKPGAEIGLVLRLLLALDADVRIEPAKTPASVHSRPDADSGAMEDDGAVFDINDLVDGADD